MAEQKMGPVQAVIMLVVIAGLVWFFFGGGLEKQAAKDLQEIHNQVADDAVAQYRIARRSGTAMDACVQAGLVAAAYLQANDEPHYRQWKRTEQADCAAAGLPR